jgi:hypothetical protein
MPRSARKKTAPARRTTKQPASRARGARATATSSRRRPAAKAAGRAKPPVAVAPRAAAADRDLRELLIAQLDGGHAHATIAQALANFPVELRGVRPDGAAHSAWQILEHLRISQWDIVEFTRDPEHRSPSWPDGYWPAEAAPPGESAWDETVRAFERELEVMKRLLRDPKRPLHRKVAHPEAKPHHTLAREAVVLAVHNGYHTAELILLRRMLGAWPA